LCPAAAWMRRCFPAVFTAGKSIFASAGAVLGGATQEDGADSDEPYHPASVLGYQVR
jgi:hypothetical protein